MVGGALLGRCVSTSGSIRKALTAKLHRPDHRTTALGRLAATGGLGFVFGPTVAGRLAAQDPFWAVYLQCAFGLAALALAAWLAAAAPTGPQAIAVAASAVVAEKRAAAKAESSGGTAEKEIRPPRGWLAAAGGVPVAGLLLTSLLLSFGFQAFPSTFFLYCKQRFGFGPAEYGSLLSALGVTWTVTQAGLLPAARGWGRLPELKLLLAAACSLTAGRATLAFAHTIPTLLVGELLVESYRRGHMLYDRNIAALSRHPVRTPRHGYGGSGDDRIFLRDHRSSCRRVADLSGDGEHGRHGGVYMRVCVCVRVCVCRGGGERGGAASPATRCPLCRPLRTVACIRLLTLKFGRRHYRGRWWRRSRMVWRSCW